MKSNILMAVMAGSLLAASPALARQNKSETVPFRMKSSTIMQVQKCLNKEGFNAGRADGKWGPKTKAALRDFQKKNKLPVTGQFSRQTLADLGINMSPSTVTGRSSSSQPKAPSPAQSSSSQSNMPPSSNNGGSSNPSSSNNGGNQQ
jgi:peptidoglycan hydrolase-like protein with peptidoglycan-binding domain